MKRLVILLAVVSTALGALAWHGPCGPGGWHHPPCGPHHGWWGRGGCNFWPGFIGGVVGGAVLGSCLSRPYYASPVVVQSTPVVVQQPTVIQQPVVVQQAAPVVVQQAAPVQTVVQATPRQVWVEGCYIDQVQANGTVVKVWNPGHYEMR